MDITTFGGLLIEIAEDEFAAGVSSDMLGRLHEEWKAAGSPKNLKEWIRSTLGGLFVCAGERPKWPRDVQDWPEREGKPMAFLGQLPVPEFGFPAGHKSSQSILFVFGTPDGPPGGWRLVTQTVHLLVTSKGEKKKKVKGADKL